MASIYHYTSAQGLLGIIKNQVLWCTNSQYLNDRTENVYAISEFNRLCKLNQSTILDIAPPDLNLEKSLKFFSDFYERLNEFLIKNLRDSYVACFTFKKDNTTHWLSYGQNSVNYAIEFERQDIEYGANSCGRKTENDLKYSYRLIGEPKSGEKYPGEHILNHFVPTTRQVSYGIELLEIILSPTELFQKVINKEIAPELLIESIFNQLLFSFSSIKNSEWIGEEEYRLILSERMNVCPDTKTLKTIEGKSDIVKWRERDGILIPYVEYPINPKIIKRVIYHSKDNDSYIVQSLNLLKRIYKLDFEIEKSQSSYYRM